MGYNTTRILRRRIGNADGLILCYSDYVSLRNPVYVTHSAGRYAVKRFRKANCPIIERLTNSLMMHGRNNGKKLLAVRIVDHAFEIVSFFLRMETAKDPGYIQRRTFGFGHP